MSSVTEELVSAVRERQVILFAGAGVSMTVGLPSWGTLIEHLGRELKLEAEVVEGVNYFTLAEYYRIKNGSIGPLRSWMDRHWSIPEDALRASRVHEIIVGLDFPIIYTTNFDRNLETAFELHGRQFVKVVSAKDIARVREGVPQIIKLHGDFDDDSSIVIAETDYLNRLFTDSPLDVKFQADALGRTILFLGYSLSDLNIRFLLYRLWRTWRASGFEKDRPRSYVFMIEANPIQQAVLEEWGIEVLTEENASRENALETFLERLAEAVGPTAALRAEGEDSSKRPG